MVGAPKSLQDLRRVDGSVMLTCRSCGEFTLRDLGDLIAEVRQLGGATSWPEFATVLTCPKRKCGARGMAAKVIPFSTGAKRRPPAEVVLLNLALIVLREAAGRSTKEAVATVEVRLALRVIHPHLGDVGLLREYWTAAAVEQRHPWTSCHQPYRWIAQRLVDNGAEVWEENRP